MDDMITDIDVTFGLELEFFIVYPEKRLLESVAPYTGRAPAGVALHQLIEEQGLPVLFLEDNRSDIDPEYTSWRVTYDTHQLQEAEENAVPTGYRAEPVELISRKFSSDRDQWQQELQAVMQVFGRMENSGCRLITNIECGFHVHVGNGDNGFPLRTVKNIYLLATVFERCFDSLHTTHRIEHEVDSGVHNPCNSPSAFFCEGKNHEHTLADRINEIEEYKSINAFIKHFDGPNAERSKYFNGKVSSINFDRLMTFSGGEVPATRTIEFRQHAGTLDVKEICAWSMTLIQLVSWCHYTEARQVYELIHENMFVREFRMYQLLGAVGVNKEIMRYFGYRTALSKDAAMRFRIAEMRSAFHGPFRALVNCLEESRYERGSAQAVAGAIERKFQNGVYGSWGQYASTLYPEWEEIEDDIDDDDVDSQTTEDLDRELLALCEVSIEDAMEDLII